MFNSLDRRDGESVVDYVQRLAVDPMVQGSTDAELARIAGVTPQRAREIRHDLEGQAFASLVMATLVRPEGESVTDFMRAAITAYGLRHCDAGRCKHTACARKRAEEQARQRLARPTHDTRQGQARGAGNQPFSGARPLDQSRGAPGTRNPGGASARSYEP
jgi:hypothetical protein